MAPFWNDYDFRAKGDVWYYNTRSYVSEQDQDLLDYISYFINLRTDIELPDDGFRGEYLLIATWEDIPHYPHYYISSYPQYYSQSYSERLEREVRLYAKYVSLLAAEGIYIDIYTLGQIELF